MSAERIVEHGRDEQSVGLGIHGPDGTMVHYLVFCARRNDRNAFIQELLRAYRIPQSGIRSIESADRSHAAIYQLSRVITDRNFVMIDM